MKRVVVCVAVMLAAQSVLADQRPVGVMWMRDSDGIVISVLHPVDYGIYLPGVSNGGGVVYMMDGNMLEFAEGPGVQVSAMAGSTAVVDGTTYQVEVSGQDVWLRDPATGVMHRTVRVSAAQGADGLQVNPHGFALD